MIIRSDSDPSADFEFKYCVTPIPESTTMPSLTTDQSAETTAGGTTDSTASTGATASTTSSTTTFNTATSWFSSNSPDYYSCPGWTWSDRSCQNVEINEFQFSCTEHTTGTCLPPVSTPRQTDPTGFQQSSQAQKTAANGHDLNEVLHKSILFYEAQRSGFLPADHRVQKVEKSC